MPETFSPTAILAIFYTVFLGQIFLLSVYFPGKIIGRVDYVLKNFPPDQYPKLYPAQDDGFAAKASKRLGIFRAVNRVIAAIGLLILASMIATGYEPDMLGGDEIFVVIYAFIQFSPLIYMEIKEHKQYRQMRQAFASTTRKAELNPRRLFNFIRPVYVVAAVALYVLWLVFYLSAPDFGNLDANEIYVTLAGVTGLNLFYAGMIARFMYGKKLDPYKAYKDQLKHIGAVVKTLVFSSIGISIFLISFQAADQYNLEVFDPPIMSLYFQLIAIFGIGVSLKIQDIETTDFEVYRDSPAQPST